MMRSWHVLLIVGLACGTVGCSTNSSNIALIDDALWIRHHDEYNMLPSNKTLWYYETGKHGYWTSSSAAKSIEAAEDEGRAYCNGEAAKDASREGNIVVPCTEMMVNARDTSPSYVQKEAAYRASTSTVPADDTETAVVDDTASTNSAMLGMMAQMMGHSTFVPRNVGTSARTPSAQTPAVPKSSQSPSVAGSAQRPQLRLANQCVEIGGDVPEAGGGYNTAVIYVSNRCSEKITVHTHGNLGPDSITITPGRHQWTTLERTLDYACFVDPGQQLCEKEMY